MWHLHCLGEPVAELIIAKKERRKRWLKTAAYGLALIGLSIGLVYLLRYLEAHLDISVQEYATTAYLVVFVTTLVSNASIFVPVAIHIFVMIAVASTWDPLVTAFVASVGGTLGEITGYYAGYLGKRIAIPENTPGYSRLVDWMKRNGPWAIFVISLQPILPFDVAGLLAGASRMPLWKFLLPCWAGKFPKYIVLCYFSAEILRFLPSCF
jgi:membrane protein YqaA with SNARE-associated domain